MDKCSEVSQLFADHTWLTLTFFSFSRFVQLPLHKSLLWSVYSSIWQPTRTGSATAEQATTAARRVLRVRAADLPGGGTRMIENVRIELELHWRFRPPPTGARGYRLSLTCKHFHISHVPGNAFQLPPRLRNERVSCPCHGRNSPIALGRVSSQCGNDIPSLVSVRAVNRCRWTPRQSRRHDLPLLRRRVCLLEIPLISCFELTQKLSERFGDPTQQFLLARVRYRQAVEIPLQAAQHVERGLRFEVLGESAPTLNGTHIPILCFVG